MTDGEFQSYKGLMPDDGAYGSRRDFDYDGDNDDEARRRRRRRKKKKSKKYGHVPSQLDWRKYGALYAVSKRNPSAKN